jgi:IPT/TIG domain/PASTA domain
VKFASRFLLVTAALAATLALCGSASAANVIVGPNLTGSEWEPQPCGLESCTFFNSELEGSGANLTSPVTGAIVRFSVLSGASAGTYRLRTATKLGASGTFIMRKMSAAVASGPLAGLESFATTLPITAGQTIGLTTNETASVEFLELGELFEFETEPPETGQVSTSFRFANVAGFDAEVQPAPTVTGLSIPSGPTTGGTAVTIAGTDLEGATSVTFGGVAAAITADSETSVTVVAPATAAAAPVPVAVTTVAGKATGPAYTYVAPVLPILPPAKKYCVVPNLKGKKLKAAKAALTNAKCKLGAVKMLSGATAKTGKVSKQGSKAGTKLAVGAKVAVTLKGTKVTHRKH